MAREGFFLSSNTFEIGGGGGSSNNNRTEREEKMLKKTDWNEGNEFRFP